MGQNISAELQWQDVSTGTSTAPLQQLTKKDAESKLAMYKFHKKRKLRKLALGGRPSTMKWYPQYITGVHDPNNPRVLLHLDECGRVNPNKRIRLEPSKWTKTRPTEQHIKDYTSSIVDPKTIAKCKKQGLQLFPDWYDHMRPHYFTLQDLSKMKKGETRKFLLMDRNLGDNVDGQPDFKVMKPTTMFKGCWAVYRHGHGVHGEIKFAWDDTFRDFVFHVNFTEGHWYPFNKDGVLPGVDPQGFSPLGGVARPYTSFPPSTPVGWRGPMIEWSKLQKAPKVFKDFRLC